jgi:hypothetical protein
VKAVIKVVVMIANDDDNKNQTFNRGGEALRDLGGSSPSRSRRR